VTFVVDWEAEPVEARLEEIGRRLRERYGSRAGEPGKHGQFEDPLDGLIETILSQQNTAAVSRRMFAALKAAFPGWRHALSAGAEAIAFVLEEARGGLSQVKASYIHRVLVQLMEERGELSLAFLRDLPDHEVRAVLEALPGVGMKTASCVLLFDLARAAMPVDSNILRVARRLGLVAIDVDAIKAEGWFDAVLPHDWATRYEFHVGAITHGRQTCRPRRPLCEECVLNSLCPSALAW